MTTMSLLTITLLGMFGSITSNPMYDMGHPVGMGFGRAMAAPRYPMFRSPMMMMPMASSYHPMAPPPPMMMASHSYPSMPHYRPHRPHPHHPSPYRQPHHQHYPSSYPLEDDSDIFRDPNIVRMLNKLEADNSAEYSEEPVAPIGVEEDAHARYGGGGEHHHMAPKYHEAEEADHYNHRSYGKQMKNMMKESNGEGKYPVEGHEEEAEEAGEEGPEAMHAYKPKKSSSPYYPPPSAQEEYYKPTNMYKVAPDSIGAWQHQAAAGQRPPVDEEEVEAGGSSAEHHHQEEVNTDDDQRYHRPSSSPLESYPKFQPDEESEGSSWRPVGSTAKRSAPSARPQLSGYQEVGAYSHALMPTLRHAKVVASDEAPEQMKQRPRVLAATDDAQAYTASSRYASLRPEQGTHYVLTRNTYHQHAH